MPTQTFRLPKTDRQRIADNLRDFVMTAMPGKELSVTVKPYVKKRTKEQNALAFAWYTDVSTATQEDSPRDVRRYCKLHHGVPIMRTEDSDFRESYDAVIKPLAYELKLIAMDHWPVTSLMDTVQLSAYLNAVHDDYARKGIHLEFPDDLKPPANDPRFNR